MSVPTSSKYYPYEHIQEYTTMVGMEKIPYIIREYLMDMPSAGYAPPDDNDYPRCRLMKYLYYDGARPLDYALPTLAQKKSIVFDPDRADAPPTEKGYRVFTQSMISQAQTIGQTMMRIYPGRTKSTAFESTTIINIVFLTSVNYVANTRTAVAERTYAMVNCALEALQGVNFGVGVGTFQMDNRVHPDCGISPITDEYANVGYRLSGAITTMGTQNG